LLATCSSKDYLQKQKRGREPKKNTTQHKNYKLQALQKKRKKPKLELRITQNINKIILKKKHKKTIIWMCNSD
jgi:hypothetical protein